MDLTAAADRLTPYLAAFAPLIGDARTQRLFSCAALLLIRRRAGLPRG